MPDVRLKTRIQNKYKTLDEWNSLSKGEFIPLKGEICYATVNNDTVYQKIGDGTTDFTELEWLNNVGIDVVDTFNDLSTSAKKDDIAFVEEPTFIETIEEEISKPFSFSKPGETVNIKLDNNTTLLSDLNWSERYPELAGKDLIYSIESSAETEDGELYIQGGFYPKSIASQMLGLNTFISFYGINYNDNLMWIKLSGLSIKDFIILIMGYEDFTEEQLQTLLLNHYNDESSELLDYNWIKWSMTETAINDNSVYYDGIYVTCEFDTTTLIDTTGIINGFYFFTTDDPNTDEALLSFDYDFYDIDSNEIEDACIDTSLALSGIFCGEQKTISYDIYSNKGLHQFDNEWESLEEKMNLPKVVETYKDLPHSYIENGIYGVSKSIEEPGPLSTEIKLNQYSTWYVDVNITAEEIKQSIRDYLNITEDIDPHPEFYCDYETADGASNSLYFSTHGDGFGGISFNEPISGYPCTIKSYFYIPNDNTLLDLPGTRNGDDITLTVNQGWYSYTYYDNGKSIYTETLPKQETESFCPFGSTEIKITHIEYYYTDIDSIEFSSFNLACLSFGIPDNSIIHPSGFYKFSNNQWNYDASLNGKQFKNAHILEEIDEALMGDIQLNSDKRHNHSNKWILDSLPQDSYDKLTNQVPANTNARHTHSNQYYLDLINSNDLDNIDKNTAARHTHANTAVLNNITADSLYQIQQNTNSRHTHDNKAYLDKITWDITKSIDDNTNASHTHSNKGVLDAITNSTILDISNNKSARHSHNNKAILDTVSSENLLTEEIKNKINTNSTDIESINGNITAIQTELQETKNAIPTKNSELKNDYGFITFQDIANKGLTDENINNLITARHSHSNQELLDSITNDVLFTENWQTICLDNVMNIATADGKASQAIGKVETLENTTIPTINNSINELSGRVETLEDTTIPAINNSINELSTTTGEMQVMINEILNGINGIEALIDNSGVL